jgi:hypothetical protein
MQARMFALCHHIKVLWAIVVPNLVFMVDFLGIGQWPPEGFGHYQSVFKDISAHRARVVWTVNLNVSVLVSNSSSCPRRQLPSRRSTRGSFTHFGLGFIRMLSPLEWIVSQSQKTKLLSGFWTSFSAFRRVWHLVDYTHKNAICAV